MDSDPTCPSSTAQGRQDRCGKFTFPAACDDRRCTRMKVGVDWDSTCEWCGDIFLRSKGVLKHFRLKTDPNVSISVLVCQRCSDEEPCTSNWKGIHGEVLVLSELEEAGIIVNYTETPWSLVPRHQAGYCENCKVPFHWNVKEQRWSTVLKADVEEPDFDPGLANPRSA